MERKVMTIDDWIQRWQNNQTGWHRALPHELLVKHFDNIAQCLPENSKIFIPLCGKSVDMKWLYDKYGFEIHGVEIDQSAVEEFFKVSNLKVEQSTVSTDLKTFKFIVILFDLKSQDSKIQLFACDFFKFDRTVSKCLYDLIWDRASFVAVNIDQREKYVKHLKSLLSANGKILLATMQYDPSTWPGPPHYVNPEDVNRYFGEYFRIQFLDSMDLSEEKIYKDRNFHLEESLYLLEWK